MKTLQKSLILALSIIPMISQAVPSYDEGFSSKMLASHNDYRAVHDAPALQWDSGLAEYAQRHADQCNFQHTHGPYGENLAAGYRSPEASVGAWYAEEKNYSYAHPQFSSATGHFTQLVWKSSRKIGCAYAPCYGKNGTPGNYVVCEYSPAGNIVNAGYFEKNVTPPQPSQAKS